MTTWDWTNAGIGSALTGVGVGPLGGFFGGKTSPTAQPVNESFQDILNQLKGYQNQYAQGQIQPSDYEQKLNDLFGDSGGKASRTIQSLEGKIGTQNVADALSPYGVNWFGGDPSGNSGKTVYSIAAPSLSSLQSQLPKDQLVPGTNIPLGSDRGQVETEAQREYQQELTGSKTNLGALADLLTKTQQNQFNYDLPGLKDDLNAQNLLNSSAYGTALSREKSNLASQTTGLLGQAGIEDSRNALSGLLANEQAGLGRQFSLADYAKEAALAKQLGAQTTPQVSPYKPNPLLTAFGGGATGAAAGAPFGPIGAGIGGVTGAAIGGLGGSK